MVVYSNGRNMSYPLRVHIAIPWEMVLFSKILILFAVIKQWRLLDPGLQRVANC